MKFVVYIYIYSYISLRLEGFYVLCQQQEGFICTLGQQLDSNFCSGRPEVAILRTHLHKFDAVLYTNLRVLTIQAPGSVGQQR